MKFNIPCIHQNDMPLLPGIKAFNDYDAVSKHASGNNISNRGVLFNLPVNDEGSPATIKQLKNFDSVQKCTVLGDEKELALLFLDIRNFTAFMEQRSPYEVIYVIRKLFVLFNDSIREAGGRIVETVGDSIYGVFGLDTGLKDAVKSSLDASRAVFHDLEVFNTTYAQPYFNLNFEIGIGLHQGNVLVGHYDIDHNNHMTVMGLPVNIAARLQAETKELNNDLIMSEEAYGLLESSGTNPVSKQVILRGISEPVPVRLMGQPYHHKPQGDDMLDYYMSMAG